MSQQQYPEPTVGALIFNPDGKMLLLKSHKWMHKYTLVGGHIELGEKMKYALKREVKEETGLDIYDIEFILFQEFIFDDAFWKNRHFIFWEYACKTKSKRVTLNSEAQAYVWVFPKKALKLPIDSYTKKAINEYLKKNP